MSVAFQQCIAVDEELAIGEIRVEIGSRDRQAVGRDASSFIGYSSGERARPFVIRVEFRKFNEPIHRVTSIAAASPTRNRDQPCDRAWIRQAIKSAHATLIDDGPAAEQGEQLIGVLFSATAFYFFG